jgi:serine/threonine-protein kinase
LIDQSDKDVGELANTLMLKVQDRFGDKTQMMDTGRSTPSGAGASRAHTPTPSDSASSGSGAFQRTNYDSMIIDASKFRPGDRIGDRYRVIRKVGKGGFGVVVLVEDEMVDDQFILKFLNPSLSSDESVVERFTHELRYSRKVTHENIIRIYDFLTFGKSYAISMEYFDSHSLADELDKKLPVDQRRMCKILRDLCSGMAAAQQVHVVHRDLKPANILINDQDIVKIVDFGLAAAASEMDKRITKTGVLVGTPTYMAPEQARGSNIDSRTDIYTIGVIMYRIFTGKPPYDEKDPMSTLLRHVEGNATPPREVNPDIPESLEKIIQKAMQVKPEDRFQSFNEMRNALNDILKELG